MSETTRPFKPGSYVHFDAWGWGTGIVMQELPGGPVYVRFVDGGATVAPGDLEPATPEQIASVKDRLPRPGASWLGV